MDEKIDVKVDVLPQVGCGGQVPHNDIEGTRCKEARIDGMTALLAAN